MKKINVIGITAVVILFLVSTSCQDAVVNNIREVTVPDSIPDSISTKKVGFELVQIKGLSNFVVWINDEPLTEEQFDAIDLPFNWRKNQPREGEPDGGKFYRSPDATEDGVFTKEEHFGYQWKFNAKVVDMNVDLPDNDDGLLAGRNIAKYHQVRFNAGRTIYVLISPDGKEYIRISRDANRTIDEAIIPSSWQIKERVLTEELILDLPNPTLNIRAENNQDSFQGPVEL